MLLEGKIALIAGAATGLASVSARLFAQEGAKVIIADINDKEGEKTIREIKQQGGEATYLHVDLSSVGEIERMVKVAAEVFGNFSIFWHNAGTLQPGHIEIIEEKSFDQELAVGLKAAIFGTKFAIPVIRQAGGGCIMYTSSMVGLRPTPYRQGYSLTHGIEKAAIIMLMRCIVAPMAQYNIRVNCICPGPVATDKWLEEQRVQAKLSGMDFDTYYKAAVERIPLKRTITEAEIASAAAFLVSDKASGMTGVAFPVDGGFAAV